MQGSLDAPPIIIRTSRPFFSIALLVAGALLLIWAVRFNHADRNMELIDYLWVVGLGFWTFISCWMLVWPSRLKIGPDGLTWEAPLGIRYWRWSDVSNFRIGMLGWIMYDLEDGTDGSLAFGWQGGADSVVSTLKAARACWL